MKPENPPCPRCGRTARKNGSYNTNKAKSQKYFCPTCKNAFSTFTNTVFWYLHHATSTVAVALELAIQLGLSYSQSKQVLQRLCNISVGRSDFTLWIKKFQGTNFPKPDFTNVWHVDEMFVKHETRTPDGKEKRFSYLWVVSDSKQRLISLHYSQKRDLEAAKEALRKAKLAAGFVPRVIVSDEYCVYPKAVKLLAGALHVKAHFKAENFLWQGQLWSLSNNPAESLNSRLRDRLRRWRGLKLFEWGKRFLDCLECFWNSRFSESLAQALLSRIPR